MMNGLKTRVGWYQVAWCYLKVLCSYYELQKCNRVTSTASFLHSEDKMNKNHYFLTFLFLPSNMFAFFPKAEYISYHSMASTGFTQQFTRVNSTIQWTQCMLESWPFIAARVLPKENLFPYQKLMSLLRNGCDTAQLKLCEQMFFWQKKKKTTN